MFHVPLLFLHFLYGPILWMGFRAVLSPAAFAVLSQLLLFPSTNGCTTHVAARSQAAGEAPIGWVVFKIESSKYCSEDSAKKTTGCPCLAGSLPDGLLLCFPSFLFLFKLVKPFISHSLSPSVIYFPLLTKRENAKGEWVEKQNPQGTQPRQRVNDWLEAKGMLGADTQRTTIVNGLASPPFKLFFMASAVCGLVCGHVAGCLRRGCPICLFPRHKSDTDRDIDKALNEMALGGSRGQILH